MAVTYNPCTLYKYAASDLHPTLRAHIEARRAADLYASAVAAVEGRVMSGYIGYNDPASAQEQDRAYLEELRQAMVEAAELAEQAAMSDHADWQDEQATAEDVRVGMH